MIPRILLAVLFLLRPVTAAAQSPASEYSIAGTVVDSATANPIPRAELALFIKSDDATTTADSLGRFVFDHLEPGKYQLYARATGYSSQGLNQHGSFFTGVVVGNGLDSRHIVFRLHPQAVIFGTVTDERGEGVRNATVLIISNSSPSPSAGSQSQTNDLGEYRFAGLLPGKYFVVVSARPWYAQNAFHFVPERSGDAQSRVVTQLRVPSDPSLDVVYPFTAYPGVTDDRSATELDLREGETIQADIPLHAVPAIHLRLTNLPPEQSASPRISASQRVFGFRHLGSALQLAQISPGEVEVAGLAPGDVTFTLSAPNGDWRYAQNLEVNATGEATVDASKTSPAATVSGRIVTQDSAAVPAAGSVRLAGSTRSAFANLKKDGAFSFPPLPLGAYEVLVNLNAPASYIQKITASGAKTAGHRLILSSPGDVQLTIAMSQGAGEVTGAAIRDSLPADGVLVLLLPESADDIDSDLRMDQSDSDGSFALANITPGKYHLLAIQDAWDLDYRSPAVIKPYLAKAQSLQIAPNDRKKLTVEVQPLIK